MCYGGAESTIQTDGVDNVSIAILTKVNELLERNGISPCEVVAAIHEADAGASRLSFEVPPQNELQMDKFERVLAALGLSADNTSLIGEDADIYARLQAAVNRSPKVRSR